MDEKIGFKDLSMFLQVVVILGLMWVGLNILTTIIYFLMG